jgi:hypothetical protein
LSEVKWPKRRKGTKYIGAIRGRVNSISPEQVLVVRRNEEGPIGVVLDGQMYQLTKAELIA